MGGIHDRPCWGGVALVSMISLAAHAGRSAGHGLVQTEPTPLRAPERIAGSLPALLSIDRGRLRTWSSFYQIQRLAARRQCLPALHILPRMRASVWRHEARARIARCWIRRGEKELARQTLRDPDPVASARELCQAAWTGAQVLSTLGDAEPAGRAYDLIRARCPHLRIAHIATQKRALGQGVRQETRAASPVDQALQEAAGWRQIGRFGRARRALSRAQRLCRLPRYRARSAHVQLAQAELSFHLGRYRRAQRELAPMLSGRRVHDRLGDRARLLLADIASRTGRSAQARELWAQMALQGGPVELERIAARELVQDLWRRGQRQRATRVLELVVEDARQRTRSLGLALDDEQRADIFRLLWFRWRLGQSVFTAPEAPLVEACASGDGARAYWLGRWLYEAGDTVRGSLWLQRSCALQPLSFACFAATRATRMSLPRLAADVAEVDAGFEHVADLDRAWWPTRHPDLRVAQAWLDRGEAAEARRWLRWVDWRGLSDNDRLAFAELMAQLNEAYRANIASRGAIGPWLASRRGRVVDRRRALAITFRRPWAQMVDRQARRLGIPASLIDAVIYQESAFDPRAYSNRRARGLMQMIPQTARRLARLEKLRGFRLSRLFDPEINIRLGSRLLAELWRRYRGEAALVLAAYHAGEPAVDRWWRRLGSLPRDVMIAEMPYMSTRSYVERGLVVMEVYRRLHHPAEEASPDPWQPSRSSFMADPGQAQMPCTPDGICTRRP